MAVPNEIHLGVNLTVGYEEPTNPVEDDLWFNCTTRMWNQYVGEVWIVVGVTPV